MDETSRDEPPRRPRRRKHKDRGASGTPSETPRAATAESTLEDRRPKRILAVSGTLVILGLSAVGTASSGASTVLDSAGAGVVLGAVLTLAGLVLIIYGIHTFGRLGPDNRAHTP